MKFLTPFCLCVSLSASAKELADYRAGDVAEADIATPVALDVVDGAATAALLSARATQFPAIFRSFPETTNVMNGEFLTAFEQAHSNFLADLSIEFHSTKLDEKVIASADFSRLVTVFGVENKHFPVTDELAAEWARGGDGRDIRQKLLATLAWAAHRPVRPDELPTGMAVGETVRLVPVVEMDQKLSFETVQQAPILSATNIATLANTRTLFRRDFPAAQQVFARELANFIQPNCFPDAPFTQLTRGAAVYKMVVSDHYDAGDILVHRGETIDAKTKAALTALNEKIKSSPPPPLAAATTTPVAPAAAPAPVAVASRPMLHSPAAEPKPRLQHVGVIITLTATSVGALLVAGWQFLRQRRSNKASVSVAQTPLPFADVVKQDLTPQVAQAVREAVQQELAAQRRELLLAQQAATDEINALVQRLDELQVPMQQRLQTYESKIQLLEKELALRNEENRELLKLKIEMISRQLETERTANLITPFSA